ncbi:hypothetical protein PoB_006361800 [Plakobranchus ocellatus]|uniref:Uncharacterized protein n=1 Tax=Plakobranchus ocellatus TaxID=259542 RepID=A0AAV4CYY3_9GAST|nr:hypothetical protein PoB_006361800 [Plakobranchus ocellatus]
MLPLLYCSQRHISHKTYRSQLFNRHTSTIDSYMSIYRRMFPHKIIPKQHLLEKHCIGHIKKYMFGLGLLGSLVFFLYIASPQQGDLRLLGPPSGQGANSGARTRDRRVPAGLRADLLATVPPTPPPREQGTENSHQMIAHIEKHQAHGFTIIIRNCTTY